MCTLRAASPWVEIGQVQARQVGEVRVRGGGVRDPDAGAPHRPETLLDEGHVALPCCLLRAWRQVVTRTVDSIE